MKEMFTAKYISIAVLCIVLFCSCGKSNSSIGSSSDTVGVDSFSAVWVKTVSMPSSNKSDSGRYYAVSFTIGDSVAYIGSGNDGMTGDLPLNDFWKFNGTEWTQISSIPVGRQQAVAFSIDGKGYVGTGTGTYAQNQNVYFNDFYCYDGSTDKWSRVANMPGAGRSRAAAFVVNNKAYVLTGMTNNSVFLQDMYSYDPSSGSWKQEAYLPNDSRVGATAFAYEGRGYIVGGSAGGGNPSSYFFEYNPDSSSWTPKRKIFNAEDSSFDDAYTNIERTDGVILVIDSKAYYMAGSDAIGGSTNSSVWAWDPAKDIWAKGGNYSEALRWGAVGFTINGKGYIGTGWDGSPHAFHDFYQFVPDAGK